MTTQENATHLKDIVKERYTQIADQTRDENATGCCGTACGCNTIDEALMAEDYTKLQGYVADADLGLGCGLPTEFAQIKAGDTVIDLGSGAGNDVFVARSIVGESGKVIGIDMTQRMIEKARINASKLNVSNVEFRLGEIENMPVAGETADVIVSNCVLNLVPNKQKAFQETFRVLKTGGHFSVSDIVVEGDLPENLKQAAEMYVGCVSGAIQKAEYLDHIKKAGFSNIQIQKEKKISIPDDILKQYISETEIKSLHDSDTRILSITVYAEKNESEKKSCCGPDCCKN
jgi:arsenite methyltransferase